MDKLVKDVFSDVCRHLELDARFISKLHAMQVGFVNKNEEHIAFFGGHLLGVHKVRFLSSDENYWFEDILQANEGELKERLHNLPGINPDFNVSSDVFNLSCVWLTHAIFTDKKLKDDQKEAAMLDVMLMMNYRFITSRLAHCFRYPADPAVAEQVYNELSYKFAIKNYKTWKDVLVNRSLDTIAKHSVHYRAFSLMNDDEDVVRMINDCQGRIRDMIKNLFEVFDRVKRNGNKIASISDVGEFDGTEVLKDKINGLNNYTQYLKSIITDRNSFIKTELVSAICRINSNMPERLFLDTLEWISDNYGVGRSQIIDECITETLTHSFDYLNENRSLLKSNVNLIPLLATLRGVYMASRSSDPVLLNIREKFEEVVFLATKNKNKNIVPSVRTGLMLYVVSRTFTKSHYS